MRKIINRRISGVDFLQNEFSPYKFLAHMDKLKALSQGNDIYPVTVELDLVDYCNHRCWWCVDPEHGNNSMDYQFAEKLLHELNILGVQAIVFKGGGEPTLNRDFPRVLEKARELGFECGIVTNGSNLHKFTDAVASMANYIRISIDGPTPSSHKAIHGSNDFSDIIRGIESTIALRDKIGRRHPVIGLSFAMDYGMIHLVEHAVNLGHGLKVDYILFRPPFFEEVGREPSMNSKEKQKLLECFERAREAYSGTMAIMIDYWISDSDDQRLMVPKKSPRRGMNMFNGANGIEHVTGRCIAAPLLAVIAADHAVYPCCNLRFLQNWSLGKISYQRGFGFKEIWKGEKRKRIMEKIHKAECIASCTHPLSKYNEIIEYLKGPMFHKGFV